MSNVAQVMILVEQALVIVHSDPLLHRYIINYHENMTWSPALL